MGKSEVELMAHLMRRAGFGATRDELEAYTALGYEAMVEEVLEPADPQAMANDLSVRVQPEGTAHWSADRRARLRGEPGATRC